MNLFVLRDKRTGEVALTLHLRLTKTKSTETKPAVSQELLLLLEILTSLLRRKTYTFLVDDDPIFYVIAHIVALACNDEAFRLPGITPRTIFTTGVRAGLNCQPIQWHDDMKDKPVFCVANGPRPRMGQEGYEALPYGRYQEWVKRLGEETGFVQVLTTYCLRRATGNAINDDPNSNEAVRNLVLDHRSKSYADANESSSSGSIAVDEALLSPVKYTPAPVEYAFEERARIAQALFEPPSSPKGEGALERQIAIVDDLVSLCTRQERRPQKRRQA
ncbi:MAG: hypothetical protein Q9167_008095 [Letrouitia subvulpina]